jgi:hypothetical protein
MLHSSSVSHDTIHQDILNSTSAVVFLGTPHRGSQDMAGIGETVRRIAATALRVDTSSAMLDALGLRSSDLQRGQEAFSRLWSTYDFRVKTFQEGLGLTGVNIGVLKDKVRCFGRLKCAWLPEAATHDSTPGTTHQRDNG